MIRNSNCVYPENELEQREPENSKLNSTSIYIESSREESLNQSNLIKKMSMKRKRFIRRLCYLVCSASILAVILAIIASVIIVAKFSKTTVLTTTTIPITASTVTTATTTTVTMSTSTTSETSSTSSISETTSTSSTSETTSTSSTSETTSTSSTSDTTSTSSTSETTSTSSTSDTTSTSSTSDTTSTSSTSETTSTSSTSDTTSTSSTSETTSTSSTSETTSTSSASTTSSTTTTTSPTCSSAGHGTLVTFNGLPTSWTLYRYNYTASATEHMLMFGFVCDGSRRRAWFLDDVSIIDTTEPSTELLENSSFDNSTIALTGWTQYCTSTCPNGAINAGKVAFGSNCTSTNCYADHCYGTGVIDFLSQIFSTTINHVYTISFRIIDYGSGTYAGTKAYVDVY